MKEYRFYDHLQQNDHDKQVGEPEHANLRTRDDTPDCPCASPEFGADSRLSYLDGELLYQRSCGTDAPTSHMCALPSVFHVIATHNQKLCVDDPYHVVLAGCCGAQEYTLSCTCRPLEKVLPPHACTICRQGRYNGPYSLLLLTRTSQVTRDAASAVDSHCAE